MDDDFTVDENGLTKDGYHILNAVSKKAMYLRNLIIIAILGAGLAAVIVFSDRIFENNRQLWCIAAAALFAIIALYLIISPQIFYRRYRYKITDDEVNIRRGVITVTHTMVPVERIHQVEVVKGPINRTFGLANVNITTAGGVATLEYLEIATAESIAAKLNEYVVAMLKERD